MSFLKMTGTLMNVLTTEPRVDKKTGEMIPSRHQVQLNVESPLENGEKRLEMHTLTVADRGPYDVAVGKQVSIPVGVFVSGGKLQFFVPKGSATSRPQASAASGGPGRTPS